MRHFLDESFPFRRIMLPLGTGLFALMSLMRGHAQAANPVYIINEDEGYGIIECFQAGVACGRVVADSWCESHGHARALAFGLASDVTGAVTTVSVPGKKIDPGSVLISCAE